ncbi:MAG TPA: hypothetical protein VJC12_02370 [Candidatus Paceibacterota bacterium]
MKKIISSLLIASVLTVGLPAQNAHALTRNEVVAIAPALSIALSQMLVVLNQEQIKMQQENMTLAQASISLSLASTRLNQVKDSATESDLQSIWNILQPVKLQVDVIAQRRAAFSAALDKIGVILVTITNGISS